MGGSKLSDMSETEGWEYLYPIDDALNDSGWVPSDIASAGFTVHKKSTDTLLTHLDRKFAGLSDQLKEHDEKASEERRILMDTLESLKKENAYYRRQMAAAYSPEKLQNRSLLVCILFLFFLGLNIYFDIQVVHPILSITVSFTSFVFLLMSFLIKKETHL